MICSSLDAQAQGLGDLQSLPASPAAFRTRKYRCKITSPGFRRRRSSNKTASATTGLPLNLPLRTVRFAREVETIKPGNFDHDEYGCGKEKYSNQLWYTPSDYARMRSERRQHGSSLCDSCATFDASVFAEDGVCGSCSCDVPKRVGPNPNPPFVFVRDLLALQGPRRDPRGLFQHSRSASKASRRRALACGAETARQVAMDRTSEAMFKTAAAGTITQQATSMPRAA